MSETGSGSIKECVVHLSSADDAAPTIIPSLGQQVQQEIAVEERTATELKTETDNLNVTSPNKTEKENDFVNSIETDEELPKPQNIENLITETTEQVKPLKEDVTVVVSNPADLNPSSSNDLLNSTSDKEENDDEKYEEEDDDDQVELETEKGTCSRSRPYVRLPSKSNVNGVTNSESLIVGIKNSQEMPTPPEEQEEGSDDVLKTKISHFSPTTPALISFSVKGEKVVNPLESSKTELLNRVVPAPDEISSTTKTEATPQLGSQLQSRDQSKSVTGESENGKFVLGSSDSAENETSSMAPATNSVSTKTELQPHSPSFIAIRTSTNSGNDESEKAIALPKPSHHDNKDKRLVSLSPAKSTSGQHHHQHGTPTTKKGSKIPVGIAVAWQRLVTSNSALANSSSSVSTVSCAPSHKVVAEMPNHHKEKVHLHSTGKIPPARPSSACPSHVDIHVSHGRDSLGHKIREDSNNKLGSYSVKRNSCVSSGGGSGGGVGGPIVGISAKRAVLETSSKSLTPVRPLPSSSVPPNLGLSYFPHPQHSASPSLLDYHYGNMRSLTPFSHQTQHNSHSHLHSLPPTWAAGNHIGVGLGSDLNVPQGFPSAGAYMQQTLQNQLTFQQHLAQQYNNYSGVSSVTSPSPHHHPHYLPPSSMSYENSLRHHYEQLLQQQHQSEYLRHFHHQQQQSQLAGHQLLAGMYNAMNDGLRTPPITFPPTTNARVPLLSPSPTGGVRTPTPNSGLYPSSTHNLSLSNLSAILPTGVPPGPSPQTTTLAPPISTNWPAELFHNNSSAALSPKSLTSSSPSPVTVQQTHQEQGSYLVNTIARSSGGSGNSNTFTTFIGGKCATPSPNLEKTFPLKDVKEDVAVFNSKAQVKKKHLSTSPDKDLDDNLGRKLPGENPGRTIQKGDLNLYPSPGVKTASLPPKHKPDTNISHGRDERDQDVLEVSHIHKTVPKTGQTTIKHDFKRLDSLIEKWDSERKLGEEKDEENLTAKTCDEMIMTSCRKSVMSERFTPSQDNDGVKVETDLDAKSAPAMDLKVRVAPSLVLFEKGETDLNQNLKLVSSLPSTLTTSPVRVTKVAPNKKAVNIKRIKDDKKIKKKMSNKKPRTIKEKPSLQHPKENRIKEKTPKPKKVKSQLVVPGEIVVVKARKPCKIKPDINFNNKNSKVQSLQLDKQPKPIVPKSKKTKAEETNRRLSSCDPLPNLSGGNKGNNVPEMNLPVDTSDKVTALSNTNSFNSDNNSTIKDCSSKVVLSPSAAVIDGHTTTTICQANSSKLSKTKNSSPKKVKVDSNKSPKRKTSATKREKAKKVKVKVEKAKVVKERERRKPVAIKSKGTEIVNSSAATSTTVILTTPNPPIISFPNNSSSTGSGPIGLNLNPLVTISSPNSGENSSSLVQNSPMIPISLPYHNSPVTLILPRILPQTTITNSHQQTSFKLVVSSQEIKIPAYVPSQPGFTNATIEGTSTSQLQTFQLHQEQNFHFHQNIRSTTSTSAIATTASPVLVTTDASEHLITRSDNTITFIRDSPMTPPHQNSPNLIEGIARQSHQLPQLVHSYPHHQPSPSSCYLSPPRTNQVLLRKDFIQTDDNHLNLLATVAQEFGFRDDLGKLASHSSSSRGSSLMTSPILSVQSPELNYPTPSSTISSCASIGSNNTTTTSTSLPSSPINTKFNSKSPHHDEYEYDETELGSINEMSLGSYKQHPVWLKIPTIVPSAANKVKTVRKRKQPKTTTAEKTGSGRSDDKPFKTQSTKKKSTCANKNTHLEPKSNRPRTKSIESESSKLKIPKILDAKPKVEKQLSPKQAKGKIKIKQQPPHSNDSSVEEENHPFRMKITLPVPKVAKIRIKLSETENPQLMDQQQKQQQSSTKSSALTNGGSSNKVKIKRRHSDGDKLKSEKKKQANYTQVRESKPFALGITSPATMSQHKNDPLRHKKRKPKNYQAHDNKSLLLSPTAVKQKKSKKKPISVDTTVPLEDSHSIKSSSGFLSSFTSLTPPPTAKMVVDGSSKGVELTNTLPSNSRTSSLFSPTNFENHQTQVANKPGESMNNRKPTWVCDPTFAASAIRVGSGSITSNISGSTANKHPIKVEKMLPFAGMSSDEDEDQILMEYERRTAERMRNEDKSGLVNFLNKADGIGQQEDNKSQLKAFVPYAITPKRTIKHQQRSLQPQLQQPHHHIKPCLKAEPRPRSGSSEEENSDAEIDFEVASLTNSIPRSHTSMLQQYRNSRKLVDVPASESKSIKAVIKNVTQNNHEQIETNKRKLSSTTTSTTQNALPNDHKKHEHVGRRLSLNLETGRTHAIEEDDDGDNSDESEEELLDIGGDYSTKAYNPHHHRLNSTTHHHHRRRQSSTNTKSTTENENKQNRNGNKHRRFSGGSASTSASFGSTLPKKLPKKRSSRSLTTSSRSSVSSVVLGSCGVSRSRSGGRRESTTTTGSTIVKDVHMEETLVPGKIELESVEELKDEMRILTEIQGLFYTGKLNALQPPDVYGVCLDNERGSAPHLIFSAEEVLEKCVREKKPRTLSVGLRICAYWSPQYSGLYPGRVSTDFNPDFNPEKDLTAIEFDDGDTGMIKLGEIRLLPSNHPIRAYDPNPLLTLEKKHRKRRHSSTNTSSGVCTGDHDEADCGESYCAKIAKLDDEEEAEDDANDEEIKKSHRPYKSLYWTWTGLGYKRSKAKKARNKEFFRGIQRGDDEVINVGDSAIFISHGNERPYIGRIEKFWEKKGQKIVNVRWFYHPEEVKSPKRIPHLKHSGALFESPHIDENDVQTIANKCEVLPYSEYKERIGRLPKLSLKNSKSTKPKDLYYICGYYDPYTYNLQVKI